MGRLDTPGVALVVVPVDGARLEGDLAVPDGATGIVVFAHGSGSSRHSPRNRRVAETLDQVGLATLLIELLTPAEEAVDRLTAQHRFDIQLLAHRLIGVVDWLGQSTPCASLPVGLFGASTGAAAALVAAAARPRAIDAVVLTRRPTRSRRNRAATRAGAHAADRRRRRPEGARVQSAGTLELLGATEKEVVVVPGATHLFEEPGALEQVA